MQFPDIQIFDVLDVLIVFILLYSIYKMLRGGVAFNIFIGMVILYATWLLVNYLNMRLLTLLLDQFVSVGIITLIVIFQPELRRFLLLIGKTTMQQRSNFLSKILINEELESALDSAKMESLKLAVAELAESRTGALIVLGDQIESSQYVKTGVIINADISKELLLSIFNKESPLHDGAVVITEGKIRAASCILPVSENSSLPSHYGLRHRAGIGISENSDQMAIIVSEENGKINVARNGFMRQIKTSKDLILELKEGYKS